MFSNIVFKGIFEHKGIIDYIRSCVDYKKYFENNKYFPCLRQTKGAEIYYTSSMYMKNDYEHDKNKIKKKKLKYTAITTTTMLTSHAKPGLYCNFNLAKAFSSFLAHYKYQ